MANTNGGHEQRAATLAGPDGWPLVDNTIQFGRDPFDFYDRCGEYGDLVPYTVGGQQFYMVRKPADIERVLSTEHAKFGKGASQREQLRWLVGDGLLTSEGDRWREQRQRIQPSFKPAKIQTYAETMTECASREMATWADGETIAIDDAMRRATVTVLARSLFGTDISAHVETIADAMVDISAPSDVPTLTALLPDWLPTPWDRQAERGVEAIDGVIESLLEEGRARPEDRDDLLSTLLVAHRQGEITRETLRDQLVTFLLAGHETTSLALTYTWYLLSETPESRKRLQDELDDVLGGETPTVSDLPDLEYTEHAITEAMRVYPPVYRVVREANEPVELAGHQVDAGTKLTLPQWLVHRDERWYDDPEEYRPERWATDRDRLEYAYFPFGGGPRRCIGMQFAKLEAQLMLATIAQEWSLYLVGPGGRLSLKPGITASPAESVEMRVRKR